MTSEGLALTSVDAAYGSRVVLHDVSMHLGPGLHVVLGPNGAGKTTLFRVAAGIMSPRTGTVLIEGRNVHATPAVKTRVGYLPHRPALLPRLTVRDTLEFWARVVDVPGRERAARVDEAIDALQLQKVARQRCGRLSRGQSQRVAIARVLVSRPAVLLLDEPTTGLDPPAARSLRDLVRDLAAQGRPVLFSTHNLSEAADLADSVVLLGRGRVLGHGPVADIVHGTGPKRVSVVGEGPIAETSERCGWTVQQAGRWWHIQIRNGTQAADVVQRLVAAGVLVREVQETENAFEDLYAELSSEQ